MKARKTQLLRELTGTEKNGGEANFARKHRGEQRPLQQQSHCILCIVCFNLRVHDVFYMMYFSLSIAIHLGLEKNTKLIFLGCEHMQTMLQILTCSTAFLSKRLHFRKVFHETTATTMLEFGP